MVLEFVLGFLLLVAASYIGTTMALRGFFGRERYQSPLAREDRGPEDGGRGSESLPDDRHDDSPRADDVPRASDVTDESDDVTNESDDVTDESKDE